MSEVVYQVPSDGVVFAVVFSELPKTMTLSEFEKLLPAFHKAIKRGFDQGIAHQTKGEPHE